MLTPRLPRVCALPACRNLFAPRYRQLFCCHEHLRAKERAALGRKPRTTVARGDRFGRLVVVGEAPPSAVPHRGAESTHPRRQVRVRCDCGAESVKRCSSLVAGTTRSCGCLRRETAPANARAGAEKRRAA